MNAVGDGEELKTVRRKSCGLQLRLPCMCIPDFPVALGYNPQRLFIRNHLDQKICHTFLIQSRRFFAFLGFPLTNLLPYWPQ